MIERSLLKTRKKQHFYFYAREKNRKVLNLLSSFQAHEKEAHPDLNSLSHFNAREKKTRKGLDSLSYFRAHEKEVHRT